MEERTNVVTYKGKPVTLIGPRLNVGQRAPDFRATDSQMQDWALSQTRGKIRLLSVVHSLDSPVCDLQTQKWEQAAEKLSGLLIYTISMDLPLAQARYSQEHGIKNMRLLSDYREAAFGTAYGLLIKETRLLSRAVFIIDADDILRYVEYVPEITEEPDYDQALAALESVAGECEREG